MASTVQNTDQAGRENGRHGRSMRPAISTDAADRDRADLAGELGHGSVQHEGCPMIVVDSGTKSCIPAKIQHKKSVTIRWYRRAKVCTLSVRGLGAKALWDLEV